MDLKFPIGEYIKKDVYTSDEINALTGIIEAAPKVYKSLAEKLTDDDLTKTYRLGAWNIQQLVHHVADIQLLHFLRMKMALTDPDYKEVTLINMDGWANTKDGSAAAIEDSLIMLEGITRRYVFLIRSLTDAELEIAYYHPVRSFHINQAQAIAMSAWHINHHLAHINIALRA